MDQDWTLPDWTDLQQLPVKYFLSTSLNSGRGERRAFFFFFLVDFSRLALIGSTLTWSTLPNGLYRIAGPTRQPQKVRWAAQGQ